MDKWEEDGWMEKNGNILWWASNDFQMGAKQMKRAVTQEQLPIAP